jgi:hypothetical protein
MYLSVLVFLGLFGGVSWVLSRWFLLVLWLLRLALVLPFALLGGGFLWVLLWLLVLFGGGCVLRLVRFRARLLSLASRLALPLLPLLLRGRVWSASLSLFVASLACGVLLFLSPRPLPLRVPLCLPRLCCRPALGLVASGGFLGLVVWLVGGSPSASFVVVALAWWRGVAARGAGSLWRVLRSLVLRLLCSCCWLGEVFVVVFGLVGVAVAVVAVAGSRSLGASFAPLVGAVVRSVVRSGRSVSIGCCVGADAFALSALVPLVRVFPPPAPRPVCFAAFGRGGVGSCSLSAVSAVSAFAAAGGSVQWWAGGDPSVALPVRLSSRTNAVIASASVSAVVFFSSPSSAGSLLACRLAVGRGLPVFAFACGFCPSLLPSLGAGSWVAVNSSGVWSSGFRWVSSQSYFFD